MSNLVYMKPPPPFPKLWKVTDPSWSAAPGPFTGEELEAQADGFATGIRPILSEYSNLWFVLDNEGSIIAESAENGW